MYDLTTATINTYEYYKLLGTPEPKEAAIQTLVEGASLEQKDQVGLIANQVLTAYEMETIQTEKLHEFKS